MLFRMSPGSGSRPTTLLGLTLPTRVRHRLYVFNTCYLTRTILLPTPLQATLGLPGQLAYA